jgi:hypothetical protein
LASHISGRALKGSFERPAAERPTRSVASLEIGEPPRKILRPLDAARRFTPAGFAFLQSWLASEAFLVFDSEMWRRTRWFYWPEAVDQFPHRVGESQKRNPIIPTTAAMTFGADSSLPSLALTVNAAVIGTANLVFFPLHVGTRLRRLRTCPMLGWESHPPEWTRLT